MSGPPPKPSHLRQRTNRKSGAGTIVALENPEIPSIPNPDARIWHPLTLKAWEHAWESPMASQWLETDTDALGRLALLWDALYKGAIGALSEIRLQEQRFGLLPLDRSRLQWEVSRAGGEALKQDRRVETTRKRTGTNDPRRLLMAVK